ncbi:hypothetical protein [Brevibacillus sp. SIMBA_076]|uniref:hypothetical protein n=1 Tax=Brevibacillus sp. SIMBA_076 TaxID=3085814 RepID=UPI00397C3902
MNEIPWSIKGFEEEKQFLSSVIKGAMSGLGWQTLDYQPNESTINPLLEKLDDMLKAV